MSVPPCIPPDADDAALRELYGSDTEEVIAFRRFLRLPQELLPESEWVEPGVPRKVIRIPDDSERRCWLLYVHGRVTGKRLLKELELRA